MHESSHRDVFGLEAENFHDVNVVRPVTRDDSIARCACVPDSLRSDSGGCKVWGALAPYISTTSNFAAAQSPLRMGPACALLCSWFGAALAEGSARYGGTVSDHRKKAVAPFWYQAGGEVSCCVLSGNTEPVLSISAQG